MSIVVSDLSFSYGSHEVLKNVSFRAEAGQLLSVLGPNGVGKSTLFQCMLKLLSGYSGRITMDGTDIRTLDAGAMAKKIAYIPQAHAPVFDFSVFDVVLMGTSAQVSDVCIPGKTQVRLAERSMERVGISHLKQRGYLQISGGERQLVLIARALAQDAKVLVMDEPTSSLDYGNQIRVLSQIKKLAGEGYTVVLSTHNPDQAFLFADRVLALSDGRVLLQGRPNDVISDELMKRLYNIDVEVHSLYMDRVRVCVPKSMIGRVAFERPGL